MQNNIEEPLDTSKPKDGLPVDLPAKFSEYFDINLVPGYSTIDVCDSNVPVLVTVSTTQGGKVDETQLRASLDLVIVIDISGSMLGFDDDGRINSKGKIDRLKIQLAKLFSFLTEQDRVSVVAFNSKARQITPL